MYSSLGLIFLFLSASYLVHIKNVNLSSALVRLSTYTFGIYLFQQFILIWLYYHTDLQSVVGIHLLPWLAFVIALVGSWGLTRIALLTKAGRRLIA